MGNDKRYEVYKIYREIEQIDKQIAAEATVIQNLIQEKIRLNDEIGGMCKKEASTGEAEASTPHLPTANEVVAKRRDERLEKLRKYVEELKEKGKTSVKISEISEHSKKIFGVRVSETSIRNYLRQIHVTIFSGIGYFDEEECKTIWGL